jgi:hypothetical protein
MTMEKDIISQKKALLIFRNLFWKIFVAISAVCTIFGFIFFDDVKDHWLLYLIGVLLLTVLISLILLINILIKREITDKTNIDIPAQLLQIISKLKKDEIDILSEAIDRYFHLYGYHNERIKLGNLLNSDRDIKNQVSNLIDKLGWAKYLQKHTDEAVSNINRGIELAASNLLFYWAAKGERHLSGIERHRRNENAFKEHLKNSKDYADKILNENEKSEMEGSLHLANAKYLLEKGGMLTDAENEANLAIQKFVNDKRRQLKVYVVLGNIYLKQQLWDKAYDTFKLGYNLSNGVRNDERAKNALGLAKIHIKSDAPRFINMQKAKEYLQEASHLKSSLKQHEIEEIETLLNGIN